MAKISYVYDSWLTLCSKSVKIYNFATLPIAGNRVVEARDPPESGVLIEDVGGESPLQGRPASVQWHWKVWSVTKNSVVENDDMVENSVV